MGIVVQKVNPSFWYKKRVLITGHTGFKGSWLSIWLQSMGANVQGFSLEPLTSPSLFYEANANNDMKSIFGDVRDYKMLLTTTKAFDPEIIFHMAAQPLVRQSYNDPLTTYETNLMGTVNILEVARHCNSVQAIINITTDKCYENNEWLWGYREEDQLGGRDPYSNSKACSELISQSFRDSFFYDQGIGIATARSGNVIGGGDWSEDRLVPDVFRASEGKHCLRIRNPHSTRPWQYVLEPLSGYLLLAENVYNNYKFFSGAWNFGPFTQDIRSVSWIVEYLSSNLPNSSWMIDDNCSHPHEAGQLKLDISKAITLLGWSPKLNMEQTLNKCLEWQKSWLENVDMRDFCKREITNFMESE
jgi:CDP-glucose 4,6-dehydratase